ILESDTVKVIQISVESILDGIKRVFSNTLFIWERE
ncbi:hypothetical protein LCGC14_3035280, partial [marine sediment metagenome]